MNSPPEIGSPSPSTPSSGSPPPEEAYQQTTANASSSYISNLTSHIGAAFGGQSSSKRRLPTGSSFGAASSSRDTKTRRRGAEPGRTGGGPWEFKEASGGKKEKDELIDTALVEYLRKGEMSITRFEYGF